MFQTMLAGVILLSLVSCNSNFRNARCSCSGPHLTVNIDPPVSEDIEIEIKSDKENFKTTCPLALQEYPDPTIRGNCEGEGIKLEPSPSSVLASPSPLSGSRFSAPSSSPFPSYKIVNINKFTFNDFKANKIEIILRNLQGKVLGQQTFQLNFEFNSFCSKELNQCSTTEVTLQLSKPAEPTPTPSSTPSP